MQLNILVYKINEFKILYQNLKHSLNEYTMIRLYIKIKTLQTRFNRQIQDTMQEKLKFEVLASNTNLTCLYKIDIEVFLKVSAKNKIAYSGN